MPYDTPSIPRPRKPSVGRHRPGRHRRHHVEEWRVAAYTNVGRALDQRHRAAHLALAGTMVFTATGAAQVPAMGAGAAGDPATTAGGAVFADPAELGPVLDEASRHTSRENAEEAIAREALTVEAKKVTDPEPVAGLDETQMHNAAVIIRVGKDLGLPERAQIIALMTAMQESRLYNLASTALPESYDYAHEGEGSDHDSIGLFQQRPSMGWGTIEQIMDPEYAAEKFYKSLKGVSGWEDMGLSAAAQTVQVSAFPDAYAQHESVARKIVGAF